VKPKRAPNYAELNYAESMGPKLRELVESQLIADLKNYKVHDETLKFDWSDSCIEGKHADHLDGTIDRFSGVVVFGPNDELVAEGWMEFVKEGDFFLAYWEYVQTWKGDRKLSEKSTKGLPPWVWEKLPENVRANYKDQRQ
jgi:hypothetical protein